MMPLKLDTVFIEPDERTLCLVWRTGVLLPDLSEDDIERVSIEARTGKQTT